MDSSSPTSTDATASTWGSRALSAVMLLVAVAGVGCTQQPVDVQQLETDVDYQAVSSSDGPDLEAQLIEDVDEAETRVRAAVTPDVLTADVTEALLNAHEREVDVQVVADANAPESDPSIEQRFDALEQAGIRVVYGDAAFRYLPNPNLSQSVSNCSERPRKQYVVCSNDALGSSPCPGDPPPNAGSVCRPGSYNLMSHRFFIIDEGTVWNFVNGFDGSVGTIGWSAESELLHEDFGREFRQMEGGVFADSLDTYNGPVKSKNNDHLDYMSDFGVMRLRFNPQERIMKHVIDAVYSARSSIHVVTPELTNPFLLDALEYKVEHDFQVEVMVGAETQPAGSSRERLVGIGARAHGAGDALPTIVLIDANEDENGEQWPRTAMAMTHPLWHGQPLSLEPPRDPYTEDASDRVFVYPSDHYVDGSLSMFYEYTSNAGRMEQIDRTVQYVDRLLTQSQSL